MDPLPPIPSPFGARWRRHRWSVIHGLVFLLLCGAMAVLWTRWMGPTDFVGQVEVIETVVASRDDGLMTNLWVAPLQEVKVGDLVAEVITTDPRTVNNRLEVMRDRMRLTQLEMDPVLNRQRGALTYEQLSVNCAKERVELSVAQVNLDRAKSQFKREQRLHDEGVLANDLFELAQSSLKALEAEVAERTRLVERTEKSLERLAFMADAFLPGGENDPLKQALAVEEDKIRIFEGKMMPLRLAAPTNGVVTMIHRHAGEQIRAGEAIVTITGKDAGRIIGYLPQDFPGEPCIGMKVEVCTRGFKRRKAFATLLGISPNLQSITNNLIPPLAVRPTVIPSLARTLSVSLPAELKLVPGQPVDMRFVEKTK